MTTKEKANKRSTVSNEFSCGCLIFHDNAGCYMIEYCRNHKLAPEMYEIIKRFVEVTDHECDPRSNYCRIDCLWKKANAILAKAASR